LVLTNKISSSANPGQQTFNLSADAAPTTSTLTFSKVTTEGAVELHSSAIVLDAMPNATFAVSSSNTDTSSLVMTGTGTLTLQPSQQSLDEMRATVDALRHPDQATAEYQRAKAEYLAAKQQYQAANLAPLPPERVKDWRHPQAH
jgi:hypothetical protein